MADARSNGKRKPSASTAAANSTGDFKVNKQQPTQMAADQSGMHSNTIPPTPANESAPELPLRPGDPELYDDAPPSYEDAVAAGVGPVDAPRPSYVPPTPVEDNLLRQDEKRGWVD